MCLEELCGEPRTRSCLSRGKINIEGHLQSFMEIVRTKIVRWAKLRSWGGVQTPHGEAQMWIARGRLLLELPMEQMNAADNVLCITSISALLNSKILEDDVPLAAYTAVPWYVSAFCWDYNIGTVLHVHSHHPATTDMGIICICHLDFLCRFVSACEETFRRDIWVIRHIDYSW